MIKVIGTASKRDDFTTEEFVRYWRDVHAPISGAAPGMRGYVVSENFRRYHGELEVEALHASLALDEGDEEAAAELP